MLAERVNPYFGSYTTPASPDAMNVTHLGTFSSIEQLDHDGLYIIGTWSEEMSEGKVFADHPFSDYTVGDFRLFLMSTHYGHLDGKTTWIPNFGVAIITSPRLVARLWVGRIWSRQWSGFFKITYDNAILD